MGLYIEASDHCNLGFNILMPILPPFFAHSGVYFTPFPTLWLVTPCTPLVDPTPKKRQKLRSLIPPTVRVPKFCTPKDVQKIIERKEARPKELWVDIISEVIEEKFNSDD